MLPKSSWKEFFRIPPTGRGRLGKRRLSPPRSLCTIFHSPFVPLHRPNQLRRPPKSFPNFLILDVSAPVAESCARWSLSVT
ncbi:hypothetical protein CDD81_3186 [Ophiocordyceps australis]|uniref:Uncharacterized protein n=1 Tax=Ophiocordyceps australis TaxID=1399860 RepID=A0A2C5XVI7_9HYPO|nr:hypothetical protein CDD81_3186 [Ophiocordyceps australis]